MIFYFFKSLEHTTITERLGHMYGKASDGMKFHAVQQVEAAKLGKLNTELVRKALALFDWRARQARKKQETGSAWVSWPIRFTSIPSLFFQDISRQA